ncbi:winged helix-turn-helix transcriptional regulator [Chryseobacterium sp. SN22]|uniref:winged helix-turn-helix transcriptional regulator n=1 Tax=Chryseobacterium sp. SN22 TaxID=2606431 RepID=UPI0011EF4FC2|nr:winged helix-turn-helix transcriptional regulator [Chryseobacterium sp. SN22]KAA0129543.1 winged helix-turn-helix transcriptional regulator [Chryseobacterium sp. SN22]
MQKEDSQHQSADCIPHLRAISDTQYVLSGKWKVVIIGSLSFSKKRFTELRDTLEGIGSKMLTKELQELVQNRIVKRTVAEDGGKAVEYELTAYGYSVKPVIDAMASWGKQHREYIIKEMKKDDSK